MWTGGEGVSLPCPLLKKGGEAVQQAQRKKHRQLVAGAVALAALLWWGRGLLGLAVKQLLPGAIVALAALPAAVRLERRFSSGVSAALSLALLGAVLAAVLFLLVPAAAEQVRQLTGMLPQLWTNVEKMTVSVRGWLTRHGLSTGAQAALTERGQQLLASAAGGVLSRVRGVAGGVGQWLLAPVFGFYFLRDRRRLSAGLLKLLPEQIRGTAVQMFAEIRRQTAGYLRAQLMLSASVAALSSVGLLVCGVPSWAALGAVMGVLELIPYVGPVVGTALAVLFALPLGWWRALWTLGICLLVQQLESSVLTPRFIAQSTRLHPAVVILCTGLGGASAGIGGMMLAVPLVLCVRAACQVLLLRTAQRG